MKVSPGDIMVKIDAVAVDIDGTITDDKRQICISAIKALRTLENQGIPTIIVTGNVAHYAYATAVLIGSTGGMVFENGGGIFKEDKNNGEMLILGDINQVEKAHKQVMKEIPHIMSSIDNQSRFSEKCYYKDNVTREDLSNAVKDFNVEVYDSGFALHITDPKVNKGLSLKKLLSWQNISSDNVMGIGDSENDIDFLKHCGFKVAVQNADDQLKQIADYISPFKYGDGVADAINKFVLNK